MLLILRIVRSPGARLYRLLSNITLIIRMCRGIEQGFNILITCKHIFFQVLCPSYLFFYFYFITKCFVDQYVWHNRMGLSCLALHLLVNKCGKIEFKWSKCVVFILYRKTILCFIITYFFIILPTHSTLGPLIKWCLNSLHNFCQYKNL